MCIYQGHFQLQINTPLVLCWEFVVAWLQINHNDHVYDNKESYHTGQQCGSLCLYDVWQQWSSTGQRNVINQACKYLLVRLSHCWFSFFMGFFDDKKRHIFQMGCIKIEQKHEILKYPPVFHQWKGNLAEKIRLFHCLLQSCVGNDNLIWSDLSSHGSPEQYCQTCHYFVYCWVLFCCHQTEYIHKYICIYTKTPHFLYILNNVHYSGFISYI